MLGGWRLPVTANNKLDQSRNRNNAVLLLLGRCDGLVRQTSLYYFSPLHVFSCPVLSCSIFFFSLLPYDFLETFLTLYIPLSHSSTSNYFTLHCEETSVYFNIVFILFKSPVYRNRITRYHILVTFFIT